MTRRETILPIMDLHVNGPAGIPEAAGKFIDAMGAGRVFAFRAPMGAGKTTFISEVCRQLGVDDDSGSPTFSIVNEYRDGEGKPVYHFDFYRVESMEEALDLGLDDYFYSGALCFLEWPENIRELLPEEAIDVVITVEADGSRTISF